MSDSHPPPLRSSDSPSRSSIPKTKSASGRLPIKSLPDFYPDHNYKLVSAHRPPGAGSIEYVVKLTIPSENHAEFLGRAGLEKLAKHEAATAALLHFNVAGSENLMKYSVDTSSDGALQGIHDVVGCVIKMFGPAAKFSEPILVSDMKSPLWKCRLVVGDFTFEEAGPSKKKAKESVAITCIKSLKSKEIDIHIPNGKTLTFEDTLMNMLYQKLRDATSGIPKSYIRLRNVAGLYLHRTGDRTVDLSRIICVAAGANTVDAAGSKGNIVHDCNAEILAIRAFRLFLFDELQKFQSEGTESTVLERDSSELLKLSSCYTLIMIKNNPPAGDSIVFSSLPKNQNIKHLLNCDQSSPGALQFHVPIMKSNRPQGLKYVTDAHFNLKPMSNKPEFASPSDKLAVMNVTGIQGSLLSQFLQPVYIHRYVFHKTAAVRVASLHRSFYKRLEHPFSSQSSPIPPPFIHNKPKFDVDSSAKVPFDKMYGRYAGWVSQTHDVWEILKLPEGSAVSEVPNNVLRNSLESEIEFLDRKLAVAKQVESSLQASALCKRSMLEQYHILCHNDVYPGLYNAFKAKAPVYKAVKEQVRQAFKYAKLGVWPVKSFDPDNFKI